MSIDMRTEVGTEVSTDMSTEFDNPNVNEFISSMYLDSVLADVHFTFPNNDPSARVPALKGILAAGSPVFKAMFYGLLREGDTVELTDSNASAFQEFLQFFYLSKIKLTIENIKEVIRLVDKYDMLDCFDTCVAFLEAKLTSENIVWGYQLAITLNNAKLKELCEQKIQEFAVDVLKSEAFLQCERPVFEHILKFEKFNCSEIDLFDACIAWAKSLCEMNGLNAANSKNLKDQLGASFYLIPFGSMNGKELCKILSNQFYKTLFDPDELIEIMQMSHIKNFESKIFTCELRSKFLKDLICERNINAIEKIQALQWHPAERQETTWFSVNKSILLKQIHFKVKLFDAHPLNLANKVVLWNSMVEIVEYDKQSHITIAFFTFGKSRILHKSRCSVGRGGNVNNVLTLDEPIMIDSQKTYAIRMAPDTSRSQYYYQCSPWDTEIQLNDQIMIKFHQQTFEPYSLYRGLVSRLVFNQIH